MESYHGGTWDKSRHYKKHRPQRPEWQMRGPDSSTLGSGSRTSHRSGKSSPIQIANMSLDDEVPLRRRVSRNMWTALASQIVSMALVTVVFLSPGWGRTREDDPDDVLNPVIFGYYGYWLTCYRQALEKHRSYCKGTVLFSNPPGWWIAVQALGCVFLLLTFVCLLLICVYIFRLKSNRKWKLSLTYALVSTLNCMTMASCIILFAVNFLDKSWWCCPSGNRIIESILFWAWYLAVVALLAQLVATGMSIAETVRLRR